MLNKERRTNLSHDSQNQESVSNNKNIIIAVLLNFYTVGFGHLFLGFYWAGTLFLFSVIALSYFSSIILFLPLNMLGLVSNSQAIGPISLTIQVCLFVVTTFDLVLRHQHYVKKKSEKKEKSIVKAFILNLLHPGAGIFYSGLRITGIIFIILAPAIIGPIQQKLFYSIKPNETGQVGTYFILLFISILLVGCIESIISTIYIKVTRNKSVVSMEKEKQRRNIKYNIKKFIQKVVSTRAYITITNALKPSLAIAIIFGTLTYAFSFPHATIDFKPQMIGIFIVFVLLKAFIHNTELIKGEWKEHKFDVSIIFNLVILFTMGFKYAVALIVLDSVVSILVKMLYKSKNEINFKYNFNNLVKNLFAIGVAFLLILAMNPEQVYNITKAPQVFVVPTTAYVLTLLLLNYKPSKVSSAINFMTGWIFYLLTTIVFSIIFFLCIKHAMYTGIFLISFVFMVIQLLVEIQQEYLMSKLKIMEMEVSIFKDELTDAHNKKYMNNLLEDLNSKQEPYSTIMLDIDDFKNINDTYGHQVGDIALKHLVDVVKDCTRKDTDIVCRYGGEEFVLILKGADKSVASNLAERIRKNLENTPFVSPFNQTVGFTASFGVASSDECDGDNDIINVADKNLYKAKQTGKNKVITSEIGVA